MKGPTTSHLCLTLLHIQTNLSPSLILEVSNAEEKLFEAKDLYKMREIRHFKGTPMDIFSLHFLPSPECEISESFCHAMQPNGYTEGPLITKDKFHDTPQILKSADNKICMEGEGRHSLRTQLVAVPCPPEFAHSSFRRFPGQHQKPFPLQVCNFQLSPRGVLR